MDSILLLSKSTETGKEWEKIVECAIILQCLYAKLCLGGGPFNILKYAHCRPDLSISRIQLKANTMTLVEAKVEIDGFVENRENSIIICIPTYGKFPDYDLFIVYVNKKRYLNSNNITKVYGVQIKAGRGLPKHDVPEWIDEAYLVRGKAPEGVFIKNKWVYVNKASVVLLLGYSLGVLYPDNWPEYMTEDEFD